MECWVGDVICRDCRLLPVVRKDIYHDGLAGAMASADSDALYLNGQRLILSSIVAGQDGAVYRPESAPPFTSITLRGTLADGYFEVLL